MLRYLSWEKFGKCTTPLRHLNLVGMPRRRPRQTDDDIGGDNNDLDNADDQATKKTKTDAGSVATNHVKRLSRYFFDDIPCIDLAKSLLGQVLCRRLAATGQVLRGLIVETESYLGAEDAASHSYKGRRTERNEPMFMAPGTCYVYFTYGMYYCFNLSSEGPGSAVLIRSLEPLEGIESMLSLRIGARKRPSVNKINIKQLTNGPSKLCMAMDINKSNTNKLDITTSDEIWLEAGPRRIDGNEIVSCKRIGINNAGEWNDKPLRFYVRNNQFVSVRDKAAELGPS